MEPRSRDRDTEESGRALKRQRAGLLSALGASLYNPKFVWLETLMRGMHTCRKYQPDYAVNRTELIPYSYSPSLARHRSRSLCVLGCLEPDWICGSGTMDIRFTVALERGNGMVSLTRILGYASRYAAAFPSVYKTPIL